ncbi:MAG: TrkA family potassium uptake protein [Acidobacteriota bacterium]
MAGQFMIIGLGRLGRSIALQLARLGEPVLAVDANRERVEAVADYVDAAACADTTDEAALAELRPERFTCGVVAIGSQAVHASILTTTLLHQAHVPRIVARAVDDLHGRVLRAVGAHEVVNPEAELGQRLAQRLSRPNVLEQLELGGDADLAEITVPEGFVGRTLIELDVRRRHGVSVVAIRRGGQVRANLSGSERLESTDLLVVIGERASIARLASRV